MKRPARNAVKPPAASRPETREIVVSDRALPLVVTENRRSTRMTLRIEPGGRGLKLTVPVGLPRREIDRFLDRQQGWLMTRLARFTPEHPLAAGSSVAILGVDHRIEPTGRLRGVSEIAERDGVPILRVGGAPEHLRRRIRDFLKRAARRELEERVAHHAAKAGRKAHSITLRDTRSRWGSCTSGGALSFSWRIVMAPPHVVDYLAAHEVAHLREMNHGPRFWRLCEELCPHTAEARKWLKTNGTLLHAIDFD